MSHPCRFYALLPCRIRDTHDAIEIRSWFDAADTDRSGHICMFEFFIWSLSHASNKWGSYALEHAFERYDTNQNGRLDANECVACHYLLLCASKSSTDVGVCASRARVQVFGRLQGDGLCDRLTHHL
jgi:hypothetical protein